jgi:phosphatidylserine/phosphatidylglycerophosphate/cardiolipin synthase-like enzyme
VIIVLGFMFDRKDIAEAVIGAAREGSLVYVVLDRNSSLNGKAPEQRALELMMASQGVRVRLMAGDSPREDYAAIGRGDKSGFTGLQHAKAVLLGDRVLFGSCNWTTASRANGELGGLVQLGAGLRYAVKEYFWTFVRRSMPFADAVAKHEREMAGRMARLNRA